MEPNLGTVAQLVKAMWASGVYYSKGVHSNPPKMDTSAITTSAHIART